LIFAQYVFTLLSLQPSHAFLRRANDIRMPFLN
jgi:hypothetical protein